MEASWLDTEFGDLSPNASPPTCDWVSASRSQIEAVTWLKEALELAEGGRVVIFDYAATTPELAERPWTTWLRTYRQHERGGHPLEWI